MPKAKIVKCPECDLPFRKLGKKEKEECCYKGPLHCVDCHYYAKHFVGPGYEEWTEFIRFGDALVHYHAKLLGADPCLKP